MRDSAPDLSGVIARLPWGKDTPLLLSGRQRLLYFFAALALRVWLVSSPLCAARCARVHVLFGDGEPRRSLVWMRLADAAACLLNLPRPPSRDADKAGALFGRIAFAFSLFGGRDVFRAGLAHLFVTARAGRDRAELKLARGARGASAPEPTSDERCLESQASAI